MKVMRHKYHMHAGDISHVWAESVMAALVLTLSTAATLTALMFLIGKLRL